MIISYDELINILTEHWAGGTDTSPREALYVQFGDGPRTIKDTITYPIIDGGLLAIDVDEAGNALGIELM